MKQTLILIRGLPGSGKSTLAQNLLWGLDAHIDWFEADHFFEDEHEEYHFDATKLREAHEWCQKQARQTLENGRTVIVSNTFTQLWEMRPYLEMAKALNIPVQIYECKGEFGSIHDVPKDAVDRMRSRWEELK